MTGPTGVGCSTDAKWKPVDVVNCEVRIIHIYFINIYIVMELTALPFLHLHIHTHVHIYDGTEKYIKSLFLMLLWLGGGATTTGSTLPATTTRKTILTVIHCSAGHILMHETDSSDGLGTRVCV